MSITLKPIYIVDKYILSLGKTYINGPDKLQSPVFLADNQPGFAVLLLLIRSQRFSLRSSVGRILPAS